MDEQKKEELTQDTADNQKETKGKLPTTSYMLQVLAGIYLTYTGFQLSKNVLTGADDASWGFLAAGIIFIVGGCVFIFFGLRGVLRGEKEKKEEMERATEQARKEAEEAGIPVKTPRKKMSISERAKLVPSGEEAEEPSESSEEE